MYVTVTHRCTGLIEGSIMKNGILSRCLGQSILTFVFLMFGLDANACDVLKDAETIDFGEVDAEYPETGTGFVPITRMAEFDWEAFDCPVGGTNQDPLLYLRNPLKRLGTYSDGGKTYEVLDAGYDSLAYIFEYSDLNSDVMMPFNGLFHVIKLTKSPGLNRIRLRFQFGLHKRPVKPVIDAAAWIFDIRNNGSKSIFANYRLKLKIPEKTCSLIAGNDLGFDVPPARVDQFMGIGSAVEGLNFELSMRCGPGIRFFATLTDAAKPGNRSGTLSTASGSTARGVGYQIFRNGNVPVLLGPDSTEPGAENQFPVVETPTDGGDVVLSMKINYIQTDPVIRPGSANAIATITFAYQ
jgi:type 1 fimbria pilin